MYFNQAKQGFTLIELLVVVLIIGILAAVVLPQYQMAVAKSRSVEALTLLKSLANAEEVFYLANGHYATDISLLDIDIPAEQLGGWGQRNENKPNQFLYSCAGDGASACGAFAQSSNLPNFQMRLQHTAYAGEHYCEVCSGNKNNMARSICKSMQTGTGTRGGCWYLIN